MRGKKAAVNTICGLLEEAVSVICGLILPRLVLSVYGSKYNGLINSISQFLGCAVLLRSGIGGATRVALYKPLAEGNSENISRIVKATDRFMKHVGLILLGSILLFAAIFPLFVQKEFSWLFTFTLFLIIGAGSFFESFFGITYLIVLQADQRIWVVSLLKAICNIINVGFCSFLLLHKFPIHIVKLGSTCIYAAYPILQGLYVKKKYHIDRYAKPDNSALSQRWDAFWQQAATFVMDNTDIMVLTIFTNMVTVSVYSVYALVTNGLKKFMFSFLNSTESAFGNMLAKDETENLTHNVAMMETIIFSGATIIYTTAALLILDFVSLYSQGIDDAVYIQPAFAYYMLFAQFFNAVRMPYQSVIQAAGHYKQTKKFAIVEMILNIFFSCLLVHLFGLPGVAAATLIATTYRTWKYSAYMNTEILKRSNSTTFYKCFISFIESGFAIILIHYIHFKPQNSYSNWIIKALFVVSIVSAIVLAGNSIVFNKDIKRTAQKICAILKR